LPRKPLDRTSPSYKARIGYEGEYGLVRRFVEAGSAGCYAVRTPGSGSGKMAKPDIIAVDHGELLAVEVKSSTRGYAMLETQQVRRLREFAERFQVTCPSCGVNFRPKQVVAIRFVGKGWRFLELSQEGEAKPVFVRWRDNSTKPKRN